MDDIADEDFIKYGIFPEVYGTPYNKKEEEEDATIHRPRVVDETFAKPAPRRTSDFSFTPRRKQQQQQQQHAYDDDDPYDRSQRVGDAKSVVMKRLKRDDPDPDELFKGLKAVPGGPLESRPDTQTIIPYKTRMAADILLVACENREIRLDYAAQGDLKKLVNCDDEYTVIDPPIVLFDTLSTGTCVIHLKEVVRTSIFLLACFLKCTYQVEVVPDVHSNPKQYTEAKVKAYHDSNVDRFQPFGCEDTVMNVMRARFPGEELDEKLKFVKIHMMRIGHLSSFKASDPEFLWEQIEAMGPVLNNQAISRGERPRLGRDTKDE